MKYKSSALLDEFKMKTIRCSRYSVLFGILSAVVVESTSLKEELDKPHYTKAHYSLHRLVQTTTHSHLQEFEIAVPIFSNGGQLARRARRDLSSQVDEMEFTISSYGHEFRVKLSPNDRLIAEDFALKRIRRDLASGDLVEEEEHTEGLYCHHTGVMLSHENRTTAVSTCGGLYGLLRTENDDFIIEPTPHHLISDFPKSQQPHIIYKRKHIANDGQQHHFCGRRKRYPLSTSVSDIAEIKELSSGQKIIVREDDVKREHGAENLSRKRLKRGDPRRREKNKRIVETLVVADSKLIESHRLDQFDVTTYVLTVINMASSLYKDSTLDEQIDFVLVGIVLLENDEELHLDHKADKSLANFCQWQAKANTTTGRKPDHSILLTGIDICTDKNEPCDTLGLAQIGGMCSISESCTINEDTGLGVAFTVAHETGHSFGMKHDGEGNSCGKRNGHIMSASLNTINGVFTWSSCSRRSMADFFNTRRSRCLDNVPALADAALPEELPGRQYNASSQCKLQFGERASLCKSRYKDNVGQICKVLWCSKADICKTKNMPPAEGTSCGAQKWCRRGVCVENGLPGPDPVDGAWSTYGPWSECSRTCGGGISFRQRFCNKPAPRYGGRHCKGDDKIHHMCNRYKCPPGSPSYRARQCAEYNSRPYRQQYFSWIPFVKSWKYAEINQCELLCEADGFGFFDSLSPQVEDGTPCDDDSDNVCIEGKCVRVGCDSLLNSNATVDACGVCNGDNSTCLFMIGTFETAVEDNDYYHVVRIPQGARTVCIWEETCCTRTYIAARSTVDPDRYFLNGNWRVDLYGEHRFAGAKWYYERQNLQTEILWTDGPLSEDVTIEVLIVEKNPGISYSYAVKEMDNTLPHEHAQKPPRLTYLWVEKFLPCTKTCAGGEQESTAECVRDGKYAVNDSYCDETNKPRKKTRRCNDKACPARWATTKWGKCSRTCGGGIQIRRVFCRREAGNKSVDVSTNECGVSNRPPRNRVCARNDCLPKWKTTRWSKCSKSCGRGVRTRTIHCKSGMRKLPENRCDRGSKPIFRQACLVTYCRRRFQWSLSGWGSCSATCGEGKQRRSLKCTFRGKGGKLRPVNPKRCRLVEKPILQKTCSATACTRETTKIKTKATEKKTSKQDSRRNKSFQKPTSRHQKAIWVSSFWQPCTSTCGGGNQVRVVKCMQNGKPSVACSYDNKPPYVRSCNTNSCSHREEVCVDRHAWCHLVPHHNTCAHAYFEVQCCKSCKGAR